MDLLKKIVLVTMTVLLVLSFASCSEKNVKEIVVAEQYGLAYAPIVIMREKAFLEKEVGSDYTVKWQKLGNTAAIREAMLSENLDVGFMGIPPFLIGVDQGMDWKIISGLSMSPLGLMTAEADIHNLEDLVGNGKIALPQPGSIQHILLSMAAAKSFGDPKYFDYQLLSMKHPEGYQALMNDSAVTAHFTSPPYLFQEMATDSVRQLISGEEAFGGEFSFVVGVCREDFRAEEAAYNAFEVALKASIDFIKQNRVETIQILSEAYELSPEVTEDYVYTRGIKYEQQVKGVQRFSDFMYEAAYLEKQIKEEEVIW